MSHTSLLAPEAIPPHSREKVAHSSTGMNFRSSPESHGKPENTETCQHPEVPAGRMEITVLPGQLTGKRATSLNVTTKLSLGLPSPHQQDPQPPCHSLSTITQDRWHQSQLFHSMPAELLLSTQTGAQQHQLRPHHCPPVLANCWFCLHICLPTSLGAP